MGKLQEDLSQLIYKWMHVFDLNLIEVAERCIDFVLEEITSEEHECQYKEELAAVYGPRG